MVRQHDLAGGGPANRVAQPVGRRRRSGPRTRRRPSGRRRRDRPPGQRGRGAWRWGAPPEPPPPGGARPSARPRARRRPAPANVDLPARTRSRGRARRRRRHLGSGRGRPGRGRAAVRSGPSGSSTRSGATSAAGPRRLERARLGASVGSRSRHARRLGRRDLSRPAASPTRTARGSVCDAARPLSVPARAEVERKLVTVLFCDLVGFTARSDRADPEDVKATLRPYHGAISRVFDGFGATLDKFVGDGVVGVFGAPTAHEDDAERAIRAAFRIQQEIALLNEAAPERPLAVRIGIDTGDAVVAVGPGPQVGERVTGEVRHARGAAAGCRAGRRDRGRRRDTARGEGPLRVRGARDGRLAPRVGAERGLALPSARSRTRRSSVAARRRRCYGPRSAARPASPSVQLLTVVGEPGVGKSAPDPRVRRVPRRPARADPVAAGQVPPLRRRRRVLAASEMRQGRGRDPRVRPAGRGAAQARPVGRDA